MAKALNLKDERFTYCTAKEKLNTRYSDGSVMWRCLCDCGTRSWRVVQFGDEPDYESNTANVCADCLRKALSLIEQQT